MIGKKEGKGPEKYLLVFIPTPMVQNFPLGNGIISLFEQQYELIAFTIYNGNERSGHYRFVKKLANNNWVVISDAFVSEYLYYDQFGSNFDDKITSLLFKRSSIEREVSNMGYL